MPARIQGRAQADAMRNLYRPPDRQNGEGHAGQGVTFKAQTNGRGLPDKDTALRRLRGLLPTVAIEAGIALDVARDVHITGGCEIEDGKRLAIAYQRLKKIAQVIAEAEREAQG
jgi:hypothetical protein